MGILVVGVILAGLEIGSAAEQANAAEEEQQATDRALRERALEQRIEATQKTVQRDRQIQSLVGHQLAVEATSGFELGSATFQAISIDDFDKFAQARSNDALELKAGDVQLLQDKEQNDIKTSAQLWGDALNTGANIISGSGLVTNIARSSVQQRAKLATSSSLSSLDDENQEAQKTRKNNPGLFDKETI